MGVYRLVQREDNGIMGKENSVFKGGKSLKKSPVQSPNWRRDWVRREKIGVA